MEKIKIVGSQPEIFFPEFWTDFSYLPKKKTIQWAILNGKFLVHVFKNWPKNRRSLKSGPCSKKIEKLGIQIFACLYLFG